MVSENKFQNNYCYLFSMALWSASWSTNNSHSGEKLYLKWSMYVVHCTHLYKSMSYVHVHLSIYLITKITLFSFFPLQTGNCNLNFWTCSDISVQFETGDSSLSLFFPRWVHYFFCIFIAYEILHLSSGCNILKLDWNRHRDIVQIIFV